MAALADAALARLRVWAAAEAAPGRFLAWLAIAFGLGIVLYFAAEREPALWAAGGAAAASVLVVLAMRGRSYSALVALGFAALAAGFFSPPRCARSAPITRSCARRPRAAGDPNLANGFVCDPVGCIARLADGTVDAIVQTAEAFADDCSRAALVVARRDPPADCAATVIDRSHLGAKGALALRRIGQGWDITAARPPGYDRPWAPAATQNRADAPAAEDLEAGESSAPVAE